MRNYIQHGCAAVIEKYAAGTFKTVAPAAPKVLKPAHNGGTKMPSLPKPAPGPAAKLESSKSDSSSSVKAKPDAMAAAENTGGPVQNAHAAAAQAAGIKAAMFNFGLLPEKKAAPGEIRPDNGRTMASITRNEGRDRMDLISQTFRSVETQKSLGSLNAGNEDTLGSPEV